MHNHFAVSMLEIVVIAILVINVKLKKGHPT
jgi:hypothetical protein